MHSAPKVIAFYGVSTQETANRFLTGVLRYAQKAGEFQVRDFRVPLDNEQGPRSRPPWQGRADGALISLGRFTGRNDRETANWVLQGGVPVVSITADWSDPRIPCFRAHSRSLAKLAANHLVECECRSFLHVGFSGSSGSRKREQTLKQALAKKGFSLAAYATDYGLYGTSEDAALVCRDKKLSKLLRTLKKPLGVWALNDKFARGVCALCAHLGLAIPDDVKVLGVDDLSIGRAQSPALSSIHTPGEEIGFLAMQTLHALLQGGRGPRRPVEVPATELVVRTSTVGGIRVREDFQETMAYIARHACQGLTVDHLAERMMISRRSFEMKFRDFAGHSPGEEIRRVCLERAKELLWHTQLSVKRIAVAVGFQDTPPFTRFFRHETGLLPSEYRAGAGQ